MLICMVRKKEVVVLSICLSKVARSSYFIHRHLPRTDQVGYRESTANSVDPDYDRLLHWDLSNQYDACRMFPSSLPIDHPIIKKEETWRFYIMRYWWDIKKPSPYSWFNGFTSAFHRYKILYKPEAPPSRNGDPWSHKRFERLERRAFRMTWRLIGWLT